MDNDPLNPTELAHIELEYQIMKHELKKRSPVINSIRARRLTYFLIETRRASYAEQKIKKSLKDVLDEFDVGYDAYYDWQEKWYHLLPRAIKLWLK